MRWHMFLSHLASLEMNEEGFPPLFLGWKQSLLKLWHRPVHAWWSWGNSSPWCRLRVGEIRVPLVSQCSSLWSSQWSPSMSVEGTRPRPVQLAATTHDFHHLNDFHEPWLLYAPLSPAKKNEMLWLQCSRVVRITTQWTDQTFLDHLFFWHMAHWFSWFSWFSWHFNAAFNPKHSRGHVKEILGCSYRHIGHVSKILGSFLEAIFRDSRVRNFKLEPKAWWLTMIASWNHMRSHVTTCHGRTLAVWEMTLIVAARGSSCCRALSPAPVEHRMSIGCPSIHIVQSSGSYWLILYPIYPSPYPCLSIFVHFLSLCPPNSLFRWYIRVLICVKWMDFGDWHFDPKYPGGSWVIIILLKISDKPPK